MSSNPPPDSPRPGFHPEFSDSSPPDNLSDEELEMTWADPNLPLASPVSPSEVESAVPMALPVEPAKPDSEEPALSVEESFPTAELAAQPVEQPVTSSTIRCPICGLTQEPKETSCPDCGYYFSAADLARAAGTPPPAPAAAVLLQGRFELGELISDRGGLRRYRGRDLGDGKGQAVPVVIVQQPIPTEVKTEQTSAVSPDEEILPTFDDFPGASPATEILPLRPSWPSVGWERQLLSMLEMPALPAEVAYFSDEQHETLVLEAPTGTPLWDIWDDPEGSAQTRFARLVEVAETLRGLHRGGAMLEGVRPDMIVVDKDGVLRITDISDLLPIPVPLDASIRANLYTAPELISNPSGADARADLYSFGAMLYALHVGRELAERVDFDQPGLPKPFIPRFPDIHPAFGRLLTKTFRREVEARFPTDEAGRDDPSGFTELIRTLDTLRRTYDNVRLEIASWTSTGIVRTGNEDAYALLTASESRQDDMSDSALIFLCDGMGGYEAGEVAAALTIQFLRQNLVSQDPFRHLAGASGFATDPLTQMARPEGHARAPLDVEKVKSLIRTALKDANKQVFTTSRVPGSKRRGMGCTAEVVYLDNRNIVVGHVGDSRTYHLREGRLVQMTRDQTLVNRLVELGTLTPEEAETHPRRNELQQAIGGNPDVDPGLYHAKLSPGDWIVVCSDGLTNHVNARDLQQMLQSEASSAEQCARRLVNLTNIEGATDNVTVVVVRVT
jgi:PPM family protein phosphatase